MMPYNTRRKSLSLPSLGIHVPVTHAERAAAANRTFSNSHNNARSPVATMLTTVVKKMKRTLSDSEDSDAAHPAKRRQNSAKFEPTPPPSPPAEGVSVELDDGVDEMRSTRPIDMSSINDEIVEAVVVQLVKTGNRPHLVKELTAVLIQQLRVVQQSANACAIVSSRVSTFLKRSCWSAASPCPLAKELETVHPRRTYFYLTTCPHQPLPDPAHAATLSQLAHTRTLREIITPSLTSASEDAEERRRELSPSPEVDLSSREFDHEDDDMMMPGPPLGSLSMRGYATGATRLNSHQASGDRHHRAASPPLEKDEKEFTQTADGLQKRKLSGNMLTASPATEQLTSVDYDARDDSALFDERIVSSAPNATGAPAMTFVTSPVIRGFAMSPNLAGKRDEEASNWTEFDQMLEWDCSPENIDIEELDGLFNGY